MINKEYLDKLLKILKIKSAVGGLEISDSFLRYVYFENNQWIFISVRLPQGIISSGKIENYNAFVLALLELRRKIFNNKNSNKILNVIVSLASVDVYSQIFTLPIIEGENLEKAIKLNIQMISPEDSKNYSSWQIIDKNQNLMRLEVLSAFINKEVINSLQKALNEAKFSPRVIESYSLSLVRFFKQKVRNFKNDKNYLILNIDDNGIKSLIVRNGNLYFHYFSSWQEIIKDNRQILWDNFEVALIRHIHQVVNFYNSRWADEINGLFLITLNFKDEIKNIIFQNFTFPVLDLDLSLPESISPEWFVAIGSYLRGQISPKEDQELSLLGSGAVEEFIRRQTLSFFEFWRIFLSGALGIIILSLFIGNIFLSNILNSLQIESVSISSGQQGKEAKIFQEKIEEFNNLVVLINKIEKNYFPKNIIFKKLNEKLANNNINLKNLFFTDEKSLIKILATAKDEDNIAKFKKDLESDPFFQSIDLPFSEIKPDAEGRVFSISFLINSSKIE
ncbi:MAG: hypothetical protein KatS3mg093_245 [Candidatus Parcubacteria bacterium]|nr:MAG: hypothetical protein KatS3mg093_245 [Candidatus Parcubacteria bacterium]